MKRGKRICSFLLAICMMIIMMPTSFATAASGIKGNGTDGIYIDINAAPYTTYANKAYGQYAYGNEGCAWFASSRVCQKQEKTPLFYLDMDGIIQDTRLMVFRGGAQFKQIL